LTNLKRTQRVLDLRNNYKKKNLLNNAKELLLMKMEIKRLMNDIDYAKKQVEVLVKVLVVLQKNCAVTAGDLDKVLDDIKGKIKAKSVDARK